MPLHLPGPADLRASRARLGLTQAQLAAAAGVSQPLIARIENGSVDPRYSTLRAVIDALNQAERQEVLVRDLMTAPVTAVKATDEVGDAIAIMRERSFSQLPVTSKGIPVGSLSDKTLLHALASAKDPRALAKSPVGDIMGPPLPTASPETRADQALRILEGEPALLVMDHGRLVGIVSKSDLLKVIE